MKKFLWMFFLLSVFEVIPSAVTYKKNGGRLGDNLFSFSRALWVSYMYGYPVVYNRFQYGELLKLSRHPKYEIIKKQKKSVVIHNDVKSFFANQDDEDMLYIVPWKAYLKINWNDKKFIKVLKQEIALTNQLPLLQLPPNRLPVAVHIRTGGGFDRIDIDKDLPNKFPPMSFFIEQLQRLSMMLKNQPLYVYVFTDSKEPEKLVDILKTQVKKTNIVYDYRSKTGQDAQSILTDFFDMAQFQYFIRPQSFFSLMAEKLSEWKISISPRKSMWKNAELRVTEVTTLVR